MTEANQCPQCGAELPADAPQGVCPKCLLELGLGSQPDSQSGPQPAETTPRTSRFVPPLPEQLAPHFPQLEILELVGSGGMGAVYKARQPGLDRLVALKILPPEVGRDPAFAERFTREARALARLSHPNIVAVHDFGQTPSPLSPPGKGAGGEGAESPLSPGGRGAGGEGEAAEGGGRLYYFLMEYVDGANVRQLIQQGGLKPQEALAIVPQICEALQFAHDEGIVHRDIKPENILLDKKGRVKITDFGLAKLLGRGTGVSPVEADFSLTGTGQVMGTPHYMAPEQIERPQEVDHRADIYSLGVVFYEMLTGELPLGRFAPPSQKVQIDVRLDEVVLKTLEKEPELRYQHVSQVKTDLESITQPSAPDARMSSRARMTKGAKRSLIAVGVFSILFGLLGLCHTALTWFVDWSSILDNTEALQDVESAVFFPGFYTMSAICIGCYLSLIYIGIRFIRVDTRPIHLFTGILIFEVVYVFSLAFSLAHLCDVWGLGIAAAFGIANGGLMFQFVVLFPLWGPILAYWAKSRPLASAALLAGQVQPGVAAVAAGHAIVQGPADALIVIAGAALFMAIGVALWLGVAAPTGWDPTGQLQFTLLGMSITYVIYAAFMATAGLLMRRLRVRLFVLLCVVLVGVLLPATLALNVVMELEHIPVWPVLIPMWLGMPVAIWATVALFRQDVREAFARPGVSAVPTHKPASPGHWQEGSASPAGERRGPPPLLRSGASPEHTANLLRPGLGPQLLLLAIGLVLSTLSIAAGVVLVLAAVLTQVPGSGGFWGWMGGAFGCIIGGGGALVGTWNSYRQLEGSGDLMRSPHWTWLDRVFVGYTLLGMLSMTAALISRPWVNWVTTHSLLSLGGIIVFQGVGFLVIRALMWRAARQQAAVLPRKHLAPDPAQQKRRTP